MRALFILISLFGLAILGLLTLKPELVKSKLEAALRTDIPRTFPGDPPEKKTPAKVPAIQVKREELVGAWRATDNSQLMVLRADGRCRVALASQYKLLMDNGISASGQITSVVFADWQEERGTLRFTSIQMNEAEVAKQRVDPGNQGAKLDTWETTVFTTTLYSKRGLIKDDFHKWVKNRRIGGTITKFTGTELSLLHDKNETSHYVRVDPYTTRDPDGSNAPLWEHRVQPRPTVAPPPGMDLPEGTVIYQE